MDPLVDNRGVLCYVGAMTDEYLDDLVDMWHTHEIKGNPTLEEFIRGETGWSHLQYQAWVITGQLPLRSIDVPKPEMDR